MDKNLKIMVIDDSKIIRKLLTNTLKRIGYKNVIAHAKAIDGLKQLIEEKDFQFITLDWDIGDLYGIEVLEIIRRREYYKNTPILMVTSRHSKEDVVKAIRMGANGFLSKPFKGQEFEEKMNNLLASIKK